MQKYWWACALVAAGCLDISKQQQPAPVPTVEFDPQNAVVPFPNNLALDPTTHKVNLPASACESPTAAQIRTGVLNQLDGFGTYETTMTFTMTAPPDPDSVAAMPFVMYKIADGTMPVNPSGAQPVPVNALVTKSLRFDPSSCSTPAMVDTIAVVPLVPLDEHATYVVAVKSTLKPNGGGDYFPSGTWALVRQPTDPVTVDSNGNITAEETPLTPGADANGNGVPDTQELLGLDQLWKVHAPALTFLDMTGAIQDRHDILVAWTFTTQTTTDPLDPQVAGSPAAMIPTTKIVSFLALDVRAGVNADQYLTAAGAPCNVLPCNAVGHVFGGTITSPSYQVLGPNPLAGAPKIPGAWSDPVHPTVQDMATSVQFVALTPKSNPPPGGYPLVVFGHGLGSSKESGIAIAPQLAQQGFATIAIDFQAHGSRAVRTSNDPLLGCAGTCSTTTTTQCTQTSDCPTGESCMNGAGTPISPTTTQQCYAAFLSSDLAATRDNIRQTILDLQRVVVAAKACGATGCSSLVDSVPFPIDPNHITYMGISLGGIIGSTTSSLAGFQGSVLNVPAMGLVDVLENTQTLEIKCPLVNQLIDLGIVVGTKWDPSNPTVGTCTTNDWLMQPGYQQFAAIARWILDPADGANFAKKLAPRTFVIQEVVNDQVVSNVATDREGMLVGQSPMTADPFSPVTTTASAAILTNATQSKWVRYPTLPATDAQTGGYGNAFEHASLLRPAAVAPGHCSNDNTVTCLMDSTCGGGNVCIFPGVLGTARLQLDAITFLVVNH